MHLNVGSKMVLPIVALVVAVPALFALRLAWGSFSGADNRICYINAKGEPLVPAYKYSSFDAGYAPKIRVDGKIYTTPSAKQKGLAAELSGHTFGTRNGDLFQMWRYSAEKLADNRILVCGVAITQEQLALMIGISRQTTNQILNDLKARDLIRVQRGSLEIVDLAALRGLCQ